MANREKLENIYFLFQPIHLISKLTCLTILKKSSIKNNEDKISRMSVNINKICALILIIIIICASTFVYVYKYIHYNKQDIIDHVHLTHFSICISTAVTGLFISVLKVEEGVRKILHIISEFDELLKIPRYFYNKDTKTVKIGLISLVILYISMLVCDFISCNLNITCNLFVSVIDYAILIHFILIAQYITVIFLVKERFQLIKHFIVLPDIKYSTWYEKFERLGIININDTKNAKLLTEETRKFVIIESQTHKILNVNTINQINYIHKQKVHFKILRIAYETLCNVIHLINTIFGFQILLSIIALCTEVTSNFYYAIQNMSLSTHINAWDIITISFHIIWAIQYLSLLFVITAVCNSVKMKSNETNILLQRLLLIPELHPETVTEIELFIQQISNSKMKFTAWGFFTIDSKLMGSILGAITTVLVMLIQFHKIV
ncbi:hypothetical protein L9F63_009823 [Diploptera punctata]|uniref:Gustatory receptor n=1 Tax=Diploptera punctata TaxID=6984 RepID=A0AAD8ERN0_DIPPU|nr:hypothetical protein L9F63_009823 [Diploptera punctata]